MLPSAIWFVLLVLLILGEAATVGLTFLWFAVGALGGLLLSVLGVSVWLQISGFLLISAVTLVLVRPVAARLLKTGVSPTNADRLLHQEAWVLEEIDNAAQTGQVKCLGQVWSARSETGAVIPKQSRVSVLRIEGVKLIVRTEQREGSSYDEW